MCTASCLPARWCSHLEYRNGYDGNRARFSPDGSHVVVGGADGKIFLWNVANNTTTVHPTDGKGIQSCACSPSGSQIAIANKDASLLLWEQHTII